MNRAGYLCLCFDETEFASDRPFQVRVAASFSDALSFAVYRDGARDYKVDARHVSGVDGCSIARRSTNRSCFTQRFLRQSLRIQQDKAAKLAQPGHSHADHLA